jgi:hypothetical protein
LIVVKFAPQFPADDGILYLNNQGATGMYKRMLVAIDGSEVAKQAFESALSLAKTEDAELFVLYVIEWFWELTVAAGSND